MPEQVEYQLEEKNKKLTYAIRAIPLLLLVLFLILFRSEVGEVLGTIWSFLSLFLGKPIKPLPPTLIRSLVVVSYNFVIGFSLVMTAWLLVVASQAILPVNGWNDFTKTAEHLLYYILGMHGPAVFVHDGLTKANPGELNRRGAGVIVIDFNSAVVLEAMVPPPGLNAYLGQDEMHAVPRACGAGIVFTNPLERIRGVVDLRKQSRTNESGMPSSVDQSNRRVSAYTRDGIEVTAKIATIFTIGQDPDVIQLAYEGDIRAENLRIITLDKQQSGLLKVKFSREEIDEDDLREIHHYARVANRLDGLSPYVGLMKPSEVPTFDEKRVFAAVFSQARTPEDEVIPWDGLPPRVAVDIFRKEISQVNYDELYRLSPSHQLSLREYQNRLRAKVRNTGLLSFRMVFHQSEQPLQKNQEYEPGELLVSPVRPLTSPKVLRERGIKIIASSFGDLTPVSEAVYKQRLDSWRATWDKDTTIVQASAELEALRIRTQARLQTQQELVHHITQILGQPEQSKEILAVRIFQALESVATDPKTRQLLPMETMNIVRSVHDWLLPRDGAVNPFMLPPSKP